MTISKINMTRYLSSGASFFYTKKSLWENGCVRIEKMKKEVRSDDYN